MAPVKNGRVLFNEIPTGYPEPGKATVYDDSNTIDLDNVPLNGGILFQVIVLSIDPYMRGRMRDPKIRSYNEAFEIGEPLDNFGVARVLRSENPSVPAGVHVTGIFPFQQYVVTKEVPLQRIIENKEKLPWSVYVGVAGMPGATAYMAWKEFASPKSGETTFVTTGAGPVSSVVIQLAKADGQKVIASAGSDDKVEYMKSIGADVAFNYKKTKTVEVLEKEGRVNIYWDNVGGEVLEATLDNAAQYARFIECGMITAYNEEAYHIKKLLRIVEFEIKLFGFIVTSLFAKYPEFYTEFPKLIADGKIKYTEDITVGLENTGKAILAVQKGTNTGKSVIVVSQ